MDNLVERYIYAVTRCLPQKQRVDVAQELDSLIADMLTARCGAVLPAEHDIRVVLTELGPPDALAAQYSGEEKQALISGAYYMVYKRVLRIVLPLAGLGVAIAGVIEQITHWDFAANPYTAFGELLGKSIGGALAGAVQTFAIVTFIFAVLEHKKEPLDDGDFFSMLPSLPQNSSARIKPWEPIVGMVLTVIAAAVFLGFPQIAGVWLKGSGWVPVFDVQVIRGLWLPVALWAVTGIAKEIIKLIDAQHTRRTAIVTVAANLIAAACSVAVFRQGKIINPGFAQSISQVLAEESNELAGMLQYVHLGFLAVLLFALVVDTAETIAKHIRSSKS